MITSILTNIDGARSMSRLFPGSDDYDVLMNAATAKLDEVMAERDAAVARAEAAEREKREAMEAVGMPVDAPLSALISHHRANAALAAGFDVLAMGRLEEALDEERRRSADLFGDVDSLTLELNAARFLAARLEEALHATERALEAAHRLIDVYQADLRDQVEPAWAAYEIARAALVGAADDGRLPASVGVAWGSCMEQRDRWQSRAEKAEEALRVMENDWAFVFNLADGVELTYDVRRALAEKNLRMLRAALVGIEPRVACEHPQECCPGHRPDGSEYCHAEDCALYVPRAEVSGGTPPLSGPVRGECKPPATVGEECNPDAIRGDEASGPLSGDTPTYWLIHFEDASRAIEVYNVEESARRRSEDVGQAWTHTLFVQASAFDAAVASAGEAERDRDDAATDCAAAWATMRKIASAGDGETSAVETVLAVYMAACTETAMGFSCDLVDEVRKAEHTAVQRQRFEQALRILEEGSPPTIPVRVLYRDWVRDIVRRALHPLESHPCFDRCVRLYEKAIVDWNAGPSIQTAAETLGLDRRAYCDARLSGNQFQWTAAGTGEPFTIEHVELAWQTALRKFHMPGFPK